MSQRASTASVPSLTNYASTYQSNASSTRSFSTGAARSGSGSVHTGGYQKNQSYSLPTYANDLNQTEFFYQSGYAQPGYYIRKATGEIARVEAAFRVASRSQEIDGGGVRYKGRLGNQAVIGIGARHEGEARTRTGDGDDDGEESYQTLVIDDEGSAYNPVTAK